MVAHALFCVLWQYYDIQIAIIIFWRYKGTAHSFETWTCEIGRKTEIWTQGPKLATLCYILIILILRKLHTASTAKAFTLAPLENKVSGIPC